MNNDYNFLDNKILNICKYEYMNFFLKANVVAVGLGYKEVKGVNTFEKCIKIFVSKKLTLNQLLKKDIIPSFYKGFKTDIVESGEFTSKSLTEKIRPVLGGYSIGPKFSLYLGTLACLVTDPLENNVYMLSNNHVIAGENRLPPGTPIVQPSVADGGTLPGDQVATLSSFVRLEFDTPFKESENKVDCAIAMVSQNLIFTTRIAFIGSPQGIIPPAINMRIQRTGRTTEHQEGRITSIGATVKINYVFGQKATFLEQIITDDHSEGGDSGSLLLDLKANAVGLLCGGSNKYTFYNPIEMVLSALNVELLTNPVC